MGDSPAPSSSKRRRIDYKDPYVSVLLEHIWTLTELNRTTQHDATQGLIESLRGFEVDPSTPSLFAELEYTVERLVKGMASNRPGARRGFAFALCEVVREFTAVTSNYVLEVSDKVHAVSRGAKPQEARDIYFGKVFTLLALVRAGHACSLVAAREVAHRLTKLAVEKPYMDQLCMEGLCALADQAGASSAVRWAGRKDVFGDVTSSPLPEHVSAGQLSFLLHLEAMHVDTGCTLPGAPVLAVEHLPVLKTCLCSESVFAPSPALHRVWARLLPALFAPQGPSIISVAQFWKQVVEQGLLRTKTASGRYVALCVLAMSITMAPLVHLPIMLSPSMLRLVSDNVASTHSPLYSAARQVVAVLYTKAGVKAPPGLSSVHHGDAEDEDDDEDSSGDALDDGKVCESRVVIYRVLQAKEWRGDGTTLVQDIEAVLDNAGIQLYVDHLQAAFVSALDQENSTFTEQSSASATHPSPSSQQGVVSQRVQQMVQHMYHVATARRLPRDSKVVENVLRFLVFWGVYEGGSVPLSGAKGKRVSKPLGLVARMAHAKDALPHCPSPTRALCRDKASQLLSRLGGSTPSQLGLSDAPSASDRGVVPGSGGFFWSDVVVQLAEQLEPLVRAGALVHMNDRPLGEEEGESEDSTDTPDEEPQSKGAEVVASSLARGRMYGMLHEQRARAERSIGVAQEQQRQLHHLCSALGAECLLGADEAMDNVNEGIRCAEELEGGDEDGPDGAAVLVDLLLALMFRGAQANTRSPLVPAVEGCFRAHCSRLTPQALQCLVDVLSPPPEHTLLQTVDEEDSDDDDDDSDDDSDDDGDDDSDDSDDDSDVDDDDSDDEVDSDDDDMNLEDDDELSDDDDFTDEQMFELDKLIAMRFRLERAARQQEENTSRAVALLKLRVCDLLATFISRQEGSPMVLGLLVPLMRAVNQAERAASSHDNKQLTDKLTSLVCNRLCKPQHTPLAPFEEIEPVLRQVTTLAYNRHTPKRVAQAGMLLVVRSMMARGDDKASSEGGKGKKSKSKREKKRLKSASNTAVPPPLVNKKIASVLKEIFAPVVKKYMTKKNCTWDLDLLRTMVQRFPVLGFVLVPMVLPYSATGVSPYHRMVVFDLLAVLVRHKAALGPRAKRLRAMAPHLNDAFLGYLRAVGEESNAAGKPRWLIASLKSIRLALSALAAHLSAKKMASIFDSEALAEALKEIQRTRASSQAVRVCCNNIAQILATPTSED